MAKNEFHNKMKMLIDQFQRESKKAKSGFGAEIWRFYKQFKNYYITAIFWKQ